MYGALRPNFPMIVLGLALSITFLASCSVPAGSSSAVTTPIPITATSTAPDPATLLAGVTRSGMKSATFTLHATGGQQSSGTTVASVDGTGKLTMQPRRTAFDLAAISLFGVSTSAQVVQDENRTVYAKVPPLNQWVKIDPATLTVQIGTIDFFDFSGLRDLKLVGAESLNGQVTWHIHALADPGNAQSLPRTEDIWVRVSDDYPVQLTLQSEPALATQTTDNRSLHERVTFADWDTAIMIAIPTT